MQCPSCSSTVEVGAKFCGQCGQALPRPCPSCSHSNTAGTKFCSECGASLGTGTAKAPPPVSPATEFAPPRRSAPTASQAERRQLTVMFCDMVGSSALSTQLDPEVHRDVVAAFQSACATEIKRLDGMVAQYLGDGVLAYFGYPTAHEDDAERAVRAGLAILAAVETLRPAGHVSVQTRIGIASGIVVVGDLVREGVTQENAAIGETTNLAARLQGIAEPNTLVISPETHRLVGALFEYRDLGPHAAKGFAAPIAVRQVLRASAVENRFEARHPEGTTPLLGRDEELELLMRRWQQAKSEGGRVVLITGEAGIGKSRLTRALQEQVATEPHTRLIYHCSPYHQASALHPIIGQLARGAGFEREDAAAVSIDKLKSLLAPTSASLDGDLELFTALLSIPTGARPSDLSPQQLKERTLTALLSRLKRLCEHQPVLILFEDLHWIDPTSLELLTRIVERAADLRLLVLATARPEFAMPWPNHAHVGTLALSRLGRAEGRALVHGVTRGKELPAEVLDQIVARTDGVPLFMEELTKNVLESGLLRDIGDRYELTGQLPPRAIPSTLHASLLARLDRLASVKDVAQIGAVIGREFSYALIAAVAGLSDRGLQAALTQLVAAELIFQRGAPPDATYQFKHALVQDAAYSSLVRSRRQQLHAKIAECLQSGFPQLAAAEPETMAHHLTEAGLSAQALPYWKSAGEQAASRSANTEAVQHFRRSLSLLGDLPAARSRDQLELSLQLNLGASFVIAKGHSAEDLEPVFSRAFELCQGLESTEALPAQLGLWRYYFGRPRLRKAKDIAEQMLTLAHKSEDPMRKFLAHYMTGTTLLHLGEAARAKRYLEESLEYYPFGNELSHSTRVGNDPYATANTWLALALWALGYPDQSLSRAQQACKRADALGHPFTRAWTTFAMGLIRILRREEALARESVLTSLHLSQEHDFNGYLACAQLLLGRLLSLEAGSAEGKALLLKSLETRKQVGDILGPLHRLFLAEDAWAAGSLDEAHDFVTDALDCAGSTDQKLFQPELYRWKGILLMDGKAPDKQAGELELQRALIEAQAESLKMLELRAATSLALLWRDQGKRSQARELLAAVHSWFTEGFDLPDLRDAEALLDELKY